MDGGDWWATVHGVTKSRTRLNDFTFLSFFSALACLPSPYVFLFTNNSNDLQIFANYTGGPTVVTCKECMLSCLSPDLMFARLWFCNTPHILWFLLLLFIGMTIMVKKKKVTFLKPV